MTHQDNWGQGTERAATAYHEAAHAVIDTHIGLPLESVDIRRECGDLGGCHGIPPPQAVVLEAASLLRACAEGHPVDPGNITPATREWIDKMIQSKLAGQVAEEKFRGRPLMGFELLGIDDDQEDVRKLAGMRWSDAERAQRLRETEAEVAALIADPAIWRAIRAVAHELLERELLTGDQVNALYQAAMGG
jgi:hypothetical protein